MSVDTSLKPSGCCIDDDAIVTVPMDFVAEWCGGDVDMM